MAINSIDVALSAVTQAAVGGLETGDTGSTIDPGSPINQLQTDVTISNFGRELSAQRASASVRSTAPPSPATNDPTNEAVTVTSTTGQSATRGGMSADEAMAVYRAVSGML